MYIRCKVKDCISYKRKRCTLNFIEISENGGCASCIVDTQKLLKHDVPCAPKVSGKHKRKSLKVFK